MRRHVLHAVENTLMVDSCFELEQGNERTIPGSNCPASVEPRKVHRLRSPSVSGEHDLIMGCVVQRDRKRPIDTRKRIAPVQLVQIPKQRGVRPQRTVGWATLYPLRDLAPVADDPGENDGHTRSVRRDIVARPDELDVLRGSPVDLKPPAVAETSSSSLEVTTVG